MIFQRPRGKEGDLVTPASKERRNTMAFFDKAEATVTSAFYLVPLTPSLPQRLPAGGGEGEGEGD
jgi:hypothetical protein